MAQGRMRRKKKSPVNLFFVAIVVSCTYSCVKRRMLKSGSQQQSTVPSERTHAMDVVLTFLVATLNYMKLILMMH